MHAGGSGVKLDDDIHLSWLGPESFSLLLGLSGSVCGKSFGVRPKFGMRFIAKISNVWFAIVSEKSTVFTLFYRKAYVTKYDLAVK